MRAPLPVSLVIAMLVAGCVGEPVSETADPAPAAGTAVQGQAALCLDMGPQTPRDNSSVYGLNTESFPLGAGSGRNEPVQPPYAHQRRSTRAPVSTCL